MNHYGYEQPKPKSKDSSSTFESTFGNKLSTGDEKPLRFGA